LVEIDFKATPVEVQAGRRVASFAQSTRFAKDVVE
jgi:hypothetical protein